MRRRRAFSSGGRRRRVSTKRFFSAFKQNQRFRWHWWSALRFARCIAFLEAAGDSFRVPPGAVRSFEEGNATQIGGPTTNARVSEKRPRLHMLGRVTTTHIVRHLCRFVDTDYSFNRAANFKI
ncbi:hypothetical protein SMRU11_07740 (plasmid) [Sinorhizobium meliloti RU11/001]|nr:hypothetical protein SMRU11_07740 [Sinorhizobium meliloti RU11/001]